MSENIKKVKAADILAYAANPKNKILFEITDDGDLYPILDSVPIDVDPDTYKCSLSMAYYSYRMDDATHGISAGDCEFEILGVRFSTPSDTHDGFSTDGNEIDYGDMDKDEFWEKLQALIDIPLCDGTGDEYEFDENRVSDQDLIDAMECDCSVFAIDKDGDVCAFDDESDIPGYEDDDYDEDDEDDDEDDEEEEYRIIDQDEAFQILVKERHNLEFELLC